MPVLRAGAGSRPACDSLSFASPKESKQRKGDPQSATPSRCEGADLRRCGCGVRRGTRFALRAPLGQPRRVRSRSSRAPARLPPRNCPGAGAARRGWGAEQPNSHTGHRCARPGIGRARLQRRLPARGACAREMGPSEAMARIDVRSPSPLCAPRSAGRGAACAEGHTLRGLTRCGCLSGAPQARSEFRSAPHARAPQVAPERSAGDADSGVALSLVPFFRRRERKGLACRATPGLRPPLKHAVRHADMQTCRNAGMQECRQSPARPLTERRAVTISP